MELKNKLFELRKKAHLSQQEVADQLGVSRQSISKWELGENLPDINNIVALSQIYHVSTDYLLKETIEVVETSHNNAQLCNIISTTIVLLGLLVGQVLFKEYQNAVALLIGMSIQILGICIFQGYVIYTHNQQQQKLFLSINIWLITLLPVNYFVQYTTLYQLIYSKLFQPILSHQMGGLILIYLPFILAIGLSLIVFILIRKYFD